VDEIGFNCKSCGRLLITPLDRAGKKGRCPHCGQVQLAPPPQPAPPRDGDAGGCRYDAFISYRHVEPDRTWATWLHEALETYRTPRKLVAQGIAPRLKPVFRDEDELPASAYLNKEIERALQQSRFLIVICSPRTPPSEWVNKEAIRFREMGRGDRILALLIEGEQSQSFPRALREIRTRIAGKGGGSISILDAFTGETRSRCDIPAIEIQDFTGEGNADRMIAAFGAADSLEWYVCDLADGTKLVRLQGQNLHLRYPTFGPRHRLIAAYNDRKDPAASDITVWNATTGEGVATLPGAGPAMAFSPDGSRLFAGGIDPSLKVWDIQTGTEVISLSAPGKITSVVTSNDGRRVLSADRGGVLVWDCGDRRQDGSP